VLIFELSVSKIFEDLKFLQNSPNLESHDEAAHSQHAQLERHQGGQGWISVEN